VDVEIAFTGIPVSDLATGQVFFERLFGRPPDIVPNDREVMWRLTETARLYFLADPARAGHAAATLSVGDLDATVGELAARGIGPELVEVVGTAGRKATVRDPDGNAVALVEVY
jgi:predicted enzyme related to lactoylglutathione lyase